VVFAGLPWVWGMGIPTGIPMGMGMGMGIEIPSPLQPRVFEMRERLDTQTDIQSDRRTYRHATRSTLHPYFTRFYAAHCCVGKSLVFTSQQRAAQKRAAYVWTALYAAEANILTANWHPLFVWPWVRKTKPITPIGLVRNTASTGRATWR